MKKKKEKETFKFAQAKKPSSSPVFDYTFTCSFLIFAVKQWFLLQKVEMKIPNLSVTSFA